MRSWPSARPEGREGFEPSRSPGVVSRKWWVFSLRFVGVWRGTKKVVGLFFAFCGGLARYQKNGGSFLCVLWGSGAVNEFEFIPIPILHRHGANHTTSVIQLLN